MVIATKKPIDSLCTKIPSPSINGMRTRSKSTNLNRTKPHVHKTPIMNKQSNNRYNVSVQTDKHVTGSNSVGTQTDLYLTNMVMINELLSQDWLSDDTLNNYFELLNDKFSTIIPFLIMNPIISHAVKSVTEFNHFLEPLNIKNKDILFVPINDSEQMYPSGNQGTHWSLLIYVKQSRSFYHIDSLNSYNQTSAGTVAKKLFNYLVGDINSRLNLTQIKGPQQSNSYDCGVFVICAIELFLSKLFVNGLNFQISSIEEIAIPEVTIINKRASLAYIIKNKYNLSSQILRDLLTDWESNKIRSLPSAHTIISETAVSQTDRKRVSLTCKTTQTVHEPVVNKQLKTKPKVLIIADSHGRLCGKILQGKLKEDFQVLSIYKPNAKFHRVVENIDALTSSFTKQDYVVLMGGTNDIPAILSNPTVLTNKIISTVKSLSGQTNVIFPGIPHRFDKAPYNKTILQLNKDINKKITQLNKYSDNVVILGSTKMTRDCNTRHGLHLSIKGKEKLCSAISTTIINDYALKNDLVTVTIEDTAGRQRVDMDVFDGTIVDFQGFSDQSIMDSQFRRGLVDCSHRNTNHGHNISDFPDASVSILSEEFSSPQLYSTPGVVNVQNECTGDDSQCVSEGQPIPTIRTTSAFLE